MEDDILSLYKRRPRLTKPREDKDISPAVLHRIKTYIGSTSLGPIANRASYHASKGSMEKFGTLALEKKTDTKMEIIISSLVAMGYSVASISETSKELFGIELSKANVMAAYRRVLFTDKKKYFLNRMMKEEE